MRRSEVEASVGLKHSSIYAKMKAGTFPRSRKDPATGTVRWDEDEINAWKAKHFGCHTTT